MDTLPIYWAFYYKGSGSPLSLSETKSASMHRVHLALQVPQAVLLMLHSMVFHLSGKTVALHLDNSTAEAYLCNKDCTVYVYLSRLACYILSLDNKHGIPLISAYKHTLLNVEANYLSWGMLVPQWHLLPSIAQGALQINSQ